MYLEKPDPTKPAFELFPEMREMTQQKRCPLCKRIVNTSDAFNPSYEPDKLSDPFRDDLSRKEYLISGFVSELPGRGVWSMTHELICDNPNCGKEIVGTPHEYDDGRIFCSDDCAGEFYDGDEQ